jgi:hypothetical protein
MLQFQSITEFLIEKKQMSEAEQIHTLLQVLQPELEQAVQQRLQITEPQHNPQDPYTLDKHHGVASYCIHCKAQASTISTSQSMPALQIKIEPSKVQVAIKLAMSENGRNV